MLIELSLQLFLQHRLQIIMSWPKGAPLRQDQTFFAFLPRSNPLILAPQLQARKLYILALLDFAWIKLGVNFHKKCAAGLYF